jgi:hypothetical protein
MNTGRLATPGRTRSCPHCKATILESSSVCPGCNHHLRFDSAGMQRAPLLTPLSVEGTIKHPTGGGTWEYSVVLAVRNQRGEEITRQVVGVGALQPAEERSFTLSVEIFKPAEVREPAPAPPPAPPQRETRPPVRPSAHIPKDPRPPAPPRSEPRVLPASAVPPPAPGNGRLGGAAPGASGPSPTPRERLGAREPLPPLKK